MRRKIQIAGWTFVWLGVFVLGYAGWELYATDFINSSIQAEAQSRVTAVLEEKRTGLPPVEVIDDVEISVEFHPEGAPDVGTELAVLTVDRLGVSAVVFEGVDSETLKKGPGHMPGTAVPGQPGNSVISGHRTTYGRPFFDFDQLRPGDRVELKTAIGVTVYEVRSAEIVEPTDVWVTEDREGGWLTLTTCHPKFSARQRLIVFAEMVEGPNTAYVQLLQARSNTLD